MSGLIPVVDLLATKKGKVKEAHLILFEKCNMRCSFCHQDHDSRVGLDGDAILAKVQTLIDNTHPGEHYVVNLTGGELFTDDIPDELFGYYLEAGKRLFAHFRDLKLVFGTNLVFTKVDRVIELIETLKPLGYVCLATSYDPAGRFNAAQRVVFLENLNKVQHLVETVNVVITAQNVQLFLDGREGDEFTWMCEDFDVYFDHYIPSTRYQEHQPTEYAISELYLKLAATYPNSYPIKQWKQNHFNDTTCRSTKIVNKDGVVTTCWSEAGKDAVLDEAAGLLAKNAAEERFLEHYGCMACEYYQRCGLRCFLHHSFVEGTTAECQIKLMFDQIL